MSGRVDVAATLTKWRELPIKQYARTGTKAVYRPKAAGKPAMAAKETD